MKENIESYNIIGDVYSRCDSILYILGILNIYGEAIMEVSLSSIKHESGRSCSGGGRMD